MTNSCASDRSDVCDLTHGASAWLLWGLPFALLIAGGAWHDGMAWLWFVAFAVMGAGCLANVIRCGRLHCYVTAPLLALAAVWSLLSAVGVARLHANILSLVVLGVVLLAFLAEVPFGRYTKAHQ